MPPGTRPRGQRANRAGWSSIAWRRRGAHRGRRLGSFFAVTPTRGPGVGACGYALPFSNNARYFPYPSASSLATGMKRSEAELMQ